MSLLRTIAAVALAAGPGLGASGWAAPAAAQAPPPAGTVLSETLPLYGKPVPLPPGRWRVTAAGFGQIRETEPPAPYGAIASVLLESQGGAGENAVLLVQTNVLPVRGGWGPPAECDDPAAAFPQSEETHDLHDSCAFVLPLAAPRRLNETLPGLPPGSLSWPALLAGFRVSDRRDMLEMRYAVATQGLDRDAATRRLAGWTRPAQASALAALREPAAERPAMPAPLAGPVAGAGPGENISAARLDFYKTVTYQTAYGLATAAFVTFLAGSPVSGLAVAVWEGVTHGALYYANDLAWEWPHPPPPMPVGPVTAGAAPPSVSPPPPPVPASLAIDGKQVPLPGTGWQVVARTRDAETTGTALVQLRDGRLAGLALVHTNPRPRTAIFGASTLCSTPADGFAVIRYDTPVDGYCAYGRLLTRPGDGALWDAAVTALAARRVALPAELALVGARARTREHLLDLRLYLPAAKVENTAALAAWADLAQDALERGVRGRLAAADAVLPSPAEPAGALRTARASRTTEALQALQAAGGLGPAALERQRRAAQAAVTEDERQRWSLWSLSAAKVATYWTISLVDSVGVAWLVTGSAAQSAAYAAMDASVQPVLAYGNEIVWAGSGVGKPAASLTPVDFDSPAAP